MDRRSFLKAGSAGAVAVAGVPRLALAQSQSETTAWRAFEVVTRVQVLDAEGATRVWLPTPLTRDTEYFKSLGNEFSAEGGTANYVQEPKYATGIVAGSFPASAQNPVLKLTSRFAARDRYVDLSKPPRVAPKEDPAELRLALAPTELIPTDGIVKDTALKITKGQRTDVD